MRAPPSGGGAGQLDQDISGSPEPSAPRRLAQDRSCARRCGSRNVAQYLGEIRPVHGTTPTAPCPCGDAVFYRLTENDSWRCRTCHPLGNAGWRLVACWHYPKCDPPQHVRSAIERWHVVPAARLRP